MDAPDGPSYNELLASVWLATDYLNEETGPNFTSGGEYFGPIADNGDFFTSVRRDNLSSTVFNDSSCRSNHLWLCQPHCYLSLTFSF